MYRVGQVVVYLGLVDSDFDIPRSTVNFLVDLSNRLRKLKVPCLVVKKSHLDFDMCLSKQSMLEKIVFLHSCLSF